MPRIGEDGRYPALTVRRDSGEIDISPCIEEVSSIADGGGMDLRLVLRDHGQLKARIGEVAEAILGGSFRGMDITRTACYGWKDGWVEPL